MAEPAVALSLRTNGASRSIRDRVTRNVVAIAVRPAFVPADLATLHVEPVVPQPRPSRSPVVRRTRTNRRRNTIESRFLVEATRELYERLGEAERKVIGGSVIYRWDLGEGDGVAVVRKSTEEIKSGETIGAQIQATLRYCETAGHKPRIVVAVLNMSGLAHFDERHDFTEVFEAFRRGEASWVVYRAMDRVARSMTWTALFVHYLREYGIGLHIADLHREIDLHRPHDVAQLWVLAMAAELEASSTGERTLTALSAQMRDAGKGWSASGGFGFTRDEQGYIIVDESTWPYVLLVHELYASLRTVPAVQRALQDSHGMRLSIGVVHKILRDPRYLTGEIQTKDPKAESGYRVDTVHLPRPVPRAVWDSNQRLLSAKRGKTDVTPEGYLVTRGIPVYHARCMDTEDPSRSSHRLEARRTGSGKYRFIHRCSKPRKHTGYKTPDGCRGYTLRAEAVEAAVVHGVRAMLDDADELHRAIALGRANREPIDGGGIFTAEDRTRLTRDLRRLQQHRASLWQSHLDRIREGKRPKASLLEEEMQVIDAEVAAIKRQLATDTQLRRSSPREASMPAQIREVLTDDPPDDAERRLRRWAIVHELVTQVIVYDTDDGVSIEIYGPLVPENQDLGAWDPLTACSSTDAEAQHRPAVPEPFRNRSIPERFVPAYRWRSDPLGVFATVRVTPDLFVAAIQAASERFPVGPVFAQRGLGATRWVGVARPRMLPTDPNTIARALALFGTTPATLIREALGPQAVTHGRIQRVESRSEAVSILATAISEGLSFERGWTHQINAFGRGKPYPLNYNSLCEWATRFADGDHRSLIAEAQRTVADVRRHKRGHAAATRECAIPD